VITLISLIFIADDFDECLRKEVSLMFAEDNG